MKDAGFRLFYFFNVHIKKYIFVWRVYMNIGVLKEVKFDEHRVALLPKDVRKLCSLGHTVIVQAGAGVGTGVPDEEYIARGGDCC